MAVQTAERINAAHTNIAITGRAALTAMVDWLEAIDQPSVDGLNTYVISKAVREAGIVVAISGLGGDELFCGYHSFDVVPKSRLGCARSVGCPPESVAACRKLSRPENPPGCGRKPPTWLAPKAVSLTCTFIVAACFSNGELRALGVERNGNDFASGGLAPEMLSNLISTKTIQPGRYHSSKSTSTCVTRSCVIAMRMVWPIVSRSVFRYWIAVCSITLWHCPVKVRQPTGLVNKHLLRQAFADCLTARAYRPKETRFHTPDWALDGRPLRELCQTGIDHLESTGLLQPKGIREVWDTYLKGQDRVRWARAFSLCVLGLYAKRMGA